MRLTQYISELKLRAGTEFKVNTNTEDEYHVTMKLPSGEEFVFQALEHDGGDLYSLPFNLEKFIDMMEEREVYESWFIEFADSELETKQVERGTKVALQVFAAVEDAMIKFFKIKNPNSFFFSSSASEKKRVKLYNFLSKTILKKLPKYDLFDEVIKSEKIYFFIKK